MRARAPSSVTGAIGCAQYDGGLRKSLDNPPAAHIIHLMNATYPAFPQAESDAYDTTVAAARAARAAYWAAEAEAVADGRHFPFSSQERALWAAWKAADAASDAAWSAYQEAVRGCY